MMTKSVDFMVDAVQVCIKADCQNVIGLKPMRKGKHCRPNQAMWVNQRKCNITIMLSVRKPL